MAIGKLALHKRNEKRLREKSDAVKKKKRERNWRRGKKEEEEKNRELWRLPNQCAEFERFLGKNWKARLQSQRPNSQFVEKKQDNYKTNGKKIKLTKLVCFRNLSLFFIILVIFFLNLRT